MALFDYLPANIIGRRYRPKPDSRIEAMRRWPSLTAHVICESLGYATPSTAAQIVLDASVGRENWCEWIYSCFDRKPMEAVRNAIQNRHNHNGYMAEYRTARALVNKALGTGEEPLLASWF